MRQRLAKEMTDEEWAQVQEDMRQMDEEDRNTILICPKHGEHNKLDGCIGCMAEWFEQQIPVVP